MNAITVNIMFSRWKPTKGLGNHEKVKNHDPWNESEQVGLKYNLSPSKFLTKLLKIWCVTSSIFVIEFWICQSEWCVEWIFPLSNVYFECGGLYKHPTNKEYPEILLLGLWYWYRYWLSWISLISPAFFCAIFRVSSKNQDAVVAFIHLFI